MHLTLFLSQLSLIRGCEWKAESALECITQFAFLNRKILTPLTFCIFSRIILAWASSWKLTFFKKKFMFLFCNFVQPLLKNSWEIFKASIFVARLMCCHRYHGKTEESYWEFYFFSFKWILANLSCVCNLPVAERELFNWWKGEITLWLFPYQWCMLIIYSGIIWIPSNASPLDNISKQKLEIFPTVFS